ncbi:MAG TPA: choline dehydrogenase [Acetobacteraceae bacterium]|nr:choline dehydrogenase [Acetobacteraceae bacterium]
MVAEGDRLEADFVIVGAGSAGCVLAARLTEDASCRVILLEAGGEDRNRWIHIPLGFGKTFADPRVNWCYETEPDPGAGGRRIFWPRGKVLGGSSSINGMVYIRGQAEDFDLWRQMGCTGWSYDDVLPYFRRAEHNTRFADEWHGQGGPLCVSDVAQRNPICDAFIAAAETEGYAVNEDFNGARQEGAGYHQTTTRRGRRCSTAVGYLRPALHRANLRVVTGALAERVVFEGRRAVGVAFREHGAQRVTRATREVILCGGAINSPQLLMLSGVGSDAHLREFGIQTVVDLPGVGQGMQDRYAAGFKLRCRLPITVNDVLLSNVRKLRAGVDYYVRRRGPLAVIAAEAALFARTRPELAVPDVKLSVAPFSYDRPQDGLHRWSGFSLGCWQLRPESRGEIRLKSAEATAAPAMHANYLATEMDRRTLVAGLRIGRRLLGCPPMQTLVESEHQPGESVQSDDELLDYARRFGGTTFHPTSTCRMGMDPMAVVDPELRVRGVGALRVADASVMPTVVSGNTNAAAIMIGEKAADMVRRFEG